MELQSYRERGGEGLYPIYRVYKRLGDIVKVKGIALASRHFHILRTHDV